jgi:hypothetical protein
MYEVTGVLLCMPKLSLPFTKNHQFGVRISTHPNSIFVVRENQRYTATTPIFLEPIVREYLALDFDRLVAQRRRTFSLAYMMLHLANQSRHLHLAA